MKDIYLCKQTENYTLEDQKKEIIANYVNFIYANKNKKKSFYKTEQKKTKSNKRFLNIEIKYTFWIKKELIKMKLAIDMDLFRLTI